MRGLRLAVLVLAILSCVSASAGCAALYCATDDVEVRRRSLHALWAFAYVLLPLAVAFRWSLVPRLSSKAARLGLLFLFALDVVWLATGVWAAAHTSARLRLSLLAFSATLVCHAASMALVYRAASDVSDQAEHEHSRATP